jgi:hypothetical protein
MRQRILNINKSRWTGFPERAAVAICLLACVPTAAIAQQPGQKVFSSPEEASIALVTAAQANDEKTMLELLGPDAKQLVSSGDSTEDVNSRANFVERYREMHRLVNEPDGTVTLYIGARNWPTPIPLVQTGNSWYFDTDAGKQEILFRRIGRNELSTVRVCQELVAAENEYHNMAHGEYSGKMFSDEGQHNGLYWQAAAGETHSPIGPLVASAFVQRDAGSSKAPSTPYRGYYFHSLTSQGSHAPGGAKSYAMSGKMTEGFAFVAYPSEYRSSGVMTFIVGHDGIVYQKDLGRKTRAIAQAMTRYDPDATWHAIEKPEVEAAGQ